MNIYALEGHKVIMTEETAKNGYDYDKVELKKYLVQIDTIYTVERTEVGDCHTHVYLTEIPNVAFNSVNFEDVTEQPEDEDRLHPDWNYYNGGIL